MKLWLLRRTDSIGYDEARAFVVRALDEQGAREVAGEHSCDEGAGPWLLTATCERLSEDGGMEVILRDFYAG